MAIKAKSEHCQTFEMELITGDKEKFRFLPNI